MDSTELNSVQEVPAEILAVLSEISHEINSSLNLDQVLASAAQQVKRLVDYEIFAVLLPVENTNDLYVRFAIGHRPEVIEHWRIPLGDGIIGAAATTGQAIRVGDVSKDPRYLPAVEAVRSELAVPLIVRGRVIGVMDIESRQPDYFTPASRPFLRWSPAASAPPSKMRGFSKTHRSRPKRCCCSMKSVAKRAPLCRWKRSCVAPRN